MNNGFQLALYPKDQIAEDANIDGAVTSSAEFTLDYNVESKEEVEIIMMAAENAGAEIADSPRNRVWGGYSGQFKDPDDHLWEVVWNPEFRIEE
ncbi:hypothetical protein GCM10009000_084690 [Halobacterium noricense]|uniref:Glyoxalase/fosfomycin resistance/dioxygenase domain-containing protein n=1 Tax=Haladaptatus pallidirubidus TaxID=1008152 RepID=A0AAV3URA6_9EURY